MDNFETIYELYAKNVFKFILKLTNDYHLAEDLTQETFVKAFLHLDSFKGKSKLIVWLCQISKNLYYDYLKKSNKIIDFENIDETSSENILEDNFIKNLFATFVINC